jgi:hypothetical protein
LIKGQRVGHQDLHARDHLADATRELDAGDDVLGVLQPSLPRLVDAVEVLVEVARRVELLDHLLGLAQLHAQLDRAVHRVRRVRRPVHVVREHGPVGAHRRRVMERLDHLRRLFQRRAALARGRRIGQPVQVGHHGRLLQNDAEARWRPAQNACP